MDFILDSLTGILFIFGFVYPFHMMTKWDLKSFRAGLQITEFSRDFAHSAPSTIIGKTIDTGWLLFQFNSPNTCMLRLPLRAFRRISSSGYLLVEMQITDSKAHVIIRYPWALFIGYTTLLLGALLFFRSNSGMVTLSALMSCIGIWLLFGFLSILAARFDTYSVERAFDRFNSEFLFLSVQSAA